MVKPGTGKRRLRAPKTTGPNEEPENNEARETILRAATIHLLRNHGLFLVANSVREVRIKGFPVWIITVILRYTTGQEGYLGDLLYDGQDFTFLTEQSVMDERARQIADDPERMKKWHEYRVATLRAGEG